MIPNKVIDIHFFLQNILPSFPRPKIVKVPDSNENQKSGDAHFTPKEYFRCPILEHNVEKIDISLKWNDQVYTIYIILCIRRPLPSTDQALPSCFYFRIS